MTLVSPVEKRKSYDPIHSKLTDASKNGNVALVINLIQKGAKVKANDHMLILAAENNRDAVKALIEHGTFETNNAIKALIARGVIATPKQSFVNNALISYASHGYVDMVEFLIKHGADLDYQNSTRKTALMLAAANGHMTVVKILIRRNMDINLQDIDGNTALYFAARRGHGEIVKCLLEAGAIMHPSDSVDVLLRKRCKEAKIARDHGHTLIYKLLQNHWKKTMRKPSIYLS